jgi:hypothetical protein
MDTVIEISEVGVSRSGDDVPEVHIHVVQSEESEEMDQNDDKLGNSSTTTAKDSTVNVQSAGLVAYIMSQSNHTLSSSAGDEAMLFQAPTASEDAVDEEAAEMDEEDRAHEAEIIRITKPIFDNPLSLINLDSEVDDFLNSKRISDVSL